MNLLSLRLVFAPLFAALSIAMTQNSLIAADAKPSEPFNGKDTAGWSFKDAAKNQWAVGKAVIDPANAKRVNAEPGGNDLVNAIASGGSCDAWTNEKYGDATIELEVLVPQGSNSGIYLMGEYEIQVLDTHGKKETTYQDMGAIYKVAAPKVNAAKPAGEWQKYVIEYTAPKFDAAGKKSANAMIKKVVLNDMTIHENVELTGPTPGGLSGKEAATGPLMFQGDHGPVAYRNIRITPAK